MKNSYKPVSAVPSISTKSELEHLRAARPKPRVELHLTMDGWQQQAVHRNVNSMAEKRITFLKERLDRAGKDLRIDRLRAQLKGKSRSDFDRSR